MIAAPETYWPLKLSPVGYWGDRCSSGTNLAFLAVGDFTLESSDTPIGPRWQGT